jgi:hypothetical protein
MDGPMRLLIAQAETHWIVQCVEGTSGKILFEFSGPMLGLLRSARSAALKIVEVCNERGWTPIDIDQLKAVINLAGRAIMSVQN